jgi:uncharacterized iron-regulated membrane protein
MSFRKVVFWLHLSAGIVAGIVVLIMSVTGVLLTYEKQIIAWTDRGYLTGVPSHGAPRVPVETIVSRISETSGAAPTTVTFYANSAASSAAAGGSTYYVNAHTGELLGTSSTKMRAFFRKVTEWHRYVAMSGDNRSLGKAITGASNLLFLFLVLSGAVIWWRGAVTWFKRGLKGKALYFNWHNVFGVWALAPLFLVVLSATVISYPWASNLVYTLTGSEPPAQGQGGGRGRERAASTGGGERRQGRQGGESRANDLNSSLTAGSAPIALGEVDVALAAAERETSKWRTISVRLPAAADPSFTITVDRGSTGQPQLRSTLTVDRESGAVTNIEKFENQNLGRRARSWLRFVHTGEYYGIAGQTIAGIASFAGVMLVWTGFALSLQRLGSWVKRRRRTAEPEGVRVT